MAKSAVIFAIVCSAFIVSCSRDFGPLGPNAAQKTPDWLSNLIADRQNDPHYWGTIVYRNIWHNRYYYYFFVPISSCAFCEVYEYSGNKVDWHKNDIMDYSNNRKDETIVYCFPWPQ